MNLPRITNRQQAILQLLYRHRFLNRIQIQTMMCHKDYKTINLWLKDLREKDYVAWIYSNDFYEKTKPAIYYLGLNGIRALKSTGDYPLEELRKRYREPGRSRTFIDRCMLLADCCLNIEAQNATKGRYSYFTASDFSDIYCYFHFLAESEIRPQMCFVKEQAIKGEVITTNYLLEIFDATMPRYRIRKRLKNYIEFLESSQWQIETDNDEPTPAALFVCPTLADLIYAKRCTKRLLEDVWDDEDIHMRFSTIEELGKLGVTGKIWEEV